MCSCSLVKNRIRPGWRTLLSATMKSYLFTRSGRVSAARGPGLRSGRQEPCVLFRLNHPTGFSLLCVKFRAWDEREGDQRELPAGTCGYFLLWLGLPSAGQLATLSFFLDDLSEIFPPFIRSVVPSCQHVGITRSLIPWYFRF